MGLAQVSFAEIEILQGRFAESLGPLQNGLALATEARDWASENVARSRLADAYRLSGDYAQATVLYRQIIPRHQISGNRGGVARCLECLAFIEVQQAESAPGQEREEYLAEAARMFGAVGATREASGAQMGVREPEEYAQYVTRLRGMMDEGAYETAVAEGRRATVDEVFGPAAETERQD